MFPNGGWECGKCAGSGHSFPSCLDSSPMGDVLSLFVTGTNVVNMESMKPREIRKSIC